MWWNNSWLLELIIKNSVLNYYLEKRFCEANRLVFSPIRTASFVKQIKLEKPKELKKNISEKLGNI